MRFNETGIFQQADMISPEAFKAQRMAELRQLARYRAEKLQKYIDWSNPEKRAELQQQLKMELEEAQEQVETMDISPHMVFRELDALMKIKPLIKPLPPKKKWYQYQWMLTLFSRS